MPHGSKRFAEVVASGDMTPVGDAQLSGLTADSRQVTPGACFVCMTSARRDTHDFLPDVQAKGAVAAICHSQAGLERARGLGLAAALAEPEHLNRKVGLACRAFFDDPTAELEVVGVTGTNGKTTTTWMLRHALDALGGKAAYLGTLGFHFGEYHESLENTTPFPVELWTRLAQARDAGCTHLAMESSSHALVERRLAGVRYDVGVFTNLTQDHLDYHDTMEAYEQAKWLLFTEYAEQSGKPFVAALNTGDPIGAAWSARLDLPQVTFGAGEADLLLEPRSVTVAGLDLLARYRGEACEMHLHVGGLFNVENTGSALAALLGLGYGLGEAAKALEVVRPVPGRFEAVANDLGIGVLVDYAHTPDALENVLRSARALQPSRIITVFGCGGDRDRGKRPKMAAAVSAMSELTVVTSDNPRTEDPQRIFADIRAGVQPGSESLEIQDRREAIFEAVRLAQPGDIVVIAGKGHEDYQIIGHTKHPMDDRTMAREALEARKGR